MRRYVRANGEGVVQATADRPELLYAIHDLKNYEVRQAAINAGIDVGQQHVGSRQALGPAQVSRQALLDQMIAQGVKPEDIPKLAQIEPVPYTKPMPIPPRLLAGGKMTTLSVLYHELAHAIVGGLDGFEQYGVVSHRNPVAGRGVSAAAMFRLRQFANPATGLFRPEKLVGRIDDLTDLFAAGAAADELLSGIPRYENPGLSGDRNSAARLFAALDIPRNQHQKYFDAAMERAIAKLQKPGILEIMKDEATRREDNLPVGYHYSANRIDHILDRVRRETTPQYQLELHGQRQLFGPAAGTAEPAGARGGEAVAGTEGGGARAAAEAPRLKPFRPPRTIYTFEISGPGEPPRYVTHEALNAKQAFRELQKKYPSFNDFRLKSYEEPEIGPPVEIRDRARDLATAIDGKVVGSAAKAKGAPKDIDLRVEKYDEPAVERALREHGFEHFGSNLVSPKEAAASGKPYGKGWQRAEYFEHPDGTKLDVWHDEPVEARVSGSTVPLLRRPPKIEGEGPSTLDVAKQLNRMTRSQIGSLSLAKAAPEAMIGRARELAIEEAQYQLAQKNSGQDWYKADIAKHDQILQNELRPELKDPTKLSLFKFAEAILSVSNKPYNNVKATLPAWDHYMENGVFNPVNPATGKSWGPAARIAYGNAFRHLNNLIDQYGEKGAVDWLHADHPTSELRAINPRVPGEADEMQPGAMILGDKRGPFSLNLHGREAEFTADRWVSRTWNRWMGTIEWDNETGQMLTDAPRNNTERALMKQSFSEAAEELGLSTSELQAVLWYYEQRLYEAMGAPKESGSFGAAARRLADEAMRRASGPSRSVERTSSGLSRSPRGVVSGRASSRP